MEQSVAEIGIEKEAAKDLILQMISGATEMHMTTKKTPQTLRQEVTSPGGTTEAWIKVLQEREVKEALVDCIVEETHQSKRLGQYRQKKLTVNHCPLEVIMMATENVQIKLSIEQ